MRNTSGLFGIGLLALVSLLVAASASAAPIVAASVTPDGGGQRYAYDISTDDPLAVIDIVATLADGVDELSIETPAGWVFAGDVTSSLLVWLAADPAFYGTATHVLTGFAFVSPFAPQTGMLFLSLRDPDSSGTDSYLIDALVPVAPSVPEPGSLALVAMGGAAMLRRRIRARGVARGWRSPSKAYGRSSDGCART